MATHNILSLSITRPSTITKRMRDANVSTPHFFAESEGSVLQSINTTPIPLLYSGFLALMYFYQIRK